MKRRSGFAAMLMLWVGTTAGAFAVVDIPHQHWRSQ
jgi:hypothetical protein